MRFSAISLAALGAVASAANVTQLSTLLNSTSELSTLNTILAAYPSVLTLLQNSKNITLFAPSNNALAPLASQLSALEAIPGFIPAFLEYHVLSNTVYASAFSSTPKFLHTLLTNQTYSNVSDGQVVEAVLKNGTAELISGLKSVSNVTTPNLNVTNGVVHIIDNFLTLPPNVSTTAVDANLTAFAGAARAAKLTSAVDSLANSTFFVPTNQAFSNIGSALGNLSTTALAQILEYHVVNGSVLYSTDLSNTTLKTLEGKSLNVTIEAGAVFVNAARVVATNILVAGGVVHLIDSVLNPNGTSSTPNTSATTGAVAFPSATSGALGALTAGFTATTTVVITSHTTVAPASTAATSSSHTSTGGAAVATGMFEAAALIAGAVAFVL